MQPRTRANRGARGIRTAFTAVALGAGLASAPGVARSAVVNMRATLSGAQVVPPSASPGTGTATIRIDTQLNAFLYRIEYSGLTGPETVSFIHGYAPPGANAGTRHALPAGNPKIATWIYPEADEAQILAGNAYILIHTSMFPAGEVRGQVVPALPPEGADAFTASAEIEIELHGIGTTTLAVAGTTVVGRDEPEPEGTRETQRTEIAALEWTGTNPLLGAVTVRRSGLYASAGRIRSAPFTAFPAESTTDLFLEITTPSATYFNRNRLRAGATIDAIPPLGEVHAGDDVLLYRDGNNEAAIAGRILGITITPGASIVALPPPGTDCLDSELHMQLTVNGVGLEHVIGLGRLMLTRGAGGDPGDGRFEVPIEIVALDLAGTGTVLGDFRAVENPVAASTGVAKSAVAGVAFPVEIGIDLRTEIQLPSLGRTLVPVAPPEMHGLWNALPQIGIAIDATNMPLVVLDKQTMLPAGSLDFFYVVPDSTCEWSPDPAVDIFTASGTATIELFAGGMATVPLAGSGIGVRGPARDTGGGVLAAATELRALVLNGNAAPVGSVMMHEDAARASVGQITGTTVGSLFPAQSMISAFVALQTTTGTLRPAAAVPLVATAPLAVLPPPAGTTWTLGGGGPIDLRDSSGIPRGRLHAWSLVLGTTTPWPTDAAPPSSGDIALDALLAGVAVERNPARGRARWRLVLDRARVVRLEIFDARGALVRRVESAAAVGPAVLEWDGRDAAGRDAGAGLYLYRISVGGRERGGKLVLLR